MFLFVQQLKIGGQQLRLGEIMSDPSDLRESIEAVQSILGQMREGEFSDGLGKASVYIGSIEKSWNMYNSALESIRQQSGTDQDQYRKAVDARTRGLKASITNSIRFARMNIDQAMAHAMDGLIPRPRSVAKSDEVKRTGSLKTWFDTLDDPTSAMLEHYKGSSIPLDKYLVAGRWGHEYLKKRHIDSEAYDRELCEILSCSDSAAGRVVLNYGKLNRAIDALEEKALEAPERKV